MRDGLRALLGHLFSEGVHRVDAEAYEFNEASLGLMEGLGFVREGLKRQAHFDDEGYVETRDEDLDGDGRNDTRSVYRGGRLVERTIQELEFAPDDL